MNCAYSAKCISTLIFFSIGVQTSESTATLSDYLLRAVLTLLKREVSEHGRHLTQYFQLFQMYANLGLAEVSVISVEETVLESQHKC